MRTSALAASLTLLALSALRCATAADPAVAPGPTVVAGVMYRLDFGAPPSVKVQPFYLETDDGADKKEKEALAKKFAGPFARMANFFLQVYDLKSDCFEQYADFYDPDNKKYDRQIRIRLFKNYDAFREDFQHRYQTKTIPGAFFGINQEKDQYGTVVGKYLREVATSTEGMPDEQVLRDLYHEMAHLFMRTFIIYQVEVPSWIEEGTAELFQMRIGNGTHPEEERQERSAWLVEMIDEKSSIPWPEFIKVKNLDNLDFTYKDPLRSQIQYAQAWSVIEFMMDSKERQKAFTKLVHTFKDEGLKANQAAAAAGLTGQTFLDRVEPALYSVQEKVFKDCYGTNLVSVEDKWKEWVHKNFERDVVKNPVLRYYRGEWHVIRADYAKDKGVRESELDKAKALFEECVDKSPKTSEGYVGLGRVALKRGDFPGANEQFAKAIDNGSNNFDALLYGGIAKILGGNAAEAVPALEKAVAQRPSHWDANYYLGQALAASGGDYDACLLHLHRIMDVRKDMTGTVALTEAIVHYQHGNMGKASISFLRAANADPANGLIPLMRSVAQYENNEKDEALDTLKPLLAANDPNATALKQLMDAGQVLPKLGFNEHGQPDFVRDDKGGDKGAGKSGKSDKNGKDAGKGAKSGDKPGDTSGAGAFDIPDTP